MQLLKSMTIVLATAATLTACGTNQGPSSRQGEGQDLSGQTDTSQFTSIQWLDSTYQDLGPVTKGKLVEISWRFRNSGNKPLVIQSVRPGCGCTVADKPEAPLAPGAEGVIKGKFDSQNQSAGEHRKSIAVDANTRGTAYHQLNFRVEVVEAQ